MAFIVKSPDQSGEEKKDVESKPAKIPERKPENTVKSAEKNAEKTSAEAPQIAPEGVVAPMPDAPQAKVTWDELDLSPELLKLIQDAGFVHPTPVQAESIPMGLDGSDLIVSAQTGTGKTMAFCVPLIERCKGRQGTYALVLAPTREIALQTQAALTQFGAPLGIVSISLIGGTPLKNDEVELRKYPQIIVATPGRICDHLERGNIWLEYLEVLVLDEADRMLEMGFADQLNRILKETPENRQTLLFSATFTPTVEKLAHKILYQPHRIQIGGKAKAAKSVDQLFLFVEEDHKFSELQHLLYEERGTIFIFCRSKESAAKLWRSLRNRGFHEATQLHSDLSQTVREEALKDFKDGKYRVLIATDVVGRGIHVDEVAHVINFDIPRDADDYIHRIGRTGRAESTGKATTLVTPRDHLTLKKIEAVIGRINSQGRPSKSGK